MMEEVVGGIGGGGGGGGGAEACIKFGWRGDSGLICHRFPVLNVEHDAADDEMMTPWRLGVPGPWSVWEGCDQLGASHGSSAEMPQRRIRQRRHFEAFPVTVDYPSSKLPRVYVLFVSCPR
jgi:hypothetical protein